MTSWVGVLPSIHQPWTDACLASMHPAFRASVLVVDNTKVNRGVFRACNAGIDRMREVGADWLVYMSAAVRLGDPGGVDFIDHLDAWRDACVIEADHVFGWHLIAFHRRTIDQVGRWDENFDPYGPGDLDYSVRIRKALNLAIDPNHGVWTKVPIDVADEGMAHGINVAGVRIPPARAEWMRSYFRRKWGRHPDRPTDREYDHPFNTPSRPLSWWPKAPSGGTCDG